MALTAKSFQHPLAGLKSYSLAGNAYNTYDPAWKGHHTGEDWSSGSGDTDIGDPVRAAANGKVVYAQWAGASWGNVMIVQHTMPDGKIVSTIYGHLKEMFAAVGTSVSIGQVVGSIGDASGVYDGHLHFGVHLGALTAPGAGYISSPDTNVTSEGYVSPSLFLQAHSDSGVIVRGSTSGDTDRKALYGGTGQDTLLGGAGNDSLEGRGGNDALDGGSGADTLLGGAGNDYYVVDNVGDVVRETTSLTSTTDAGGIDTVWASVSFTLPSHVEYLALGGSAISGTGNALNNRINGNGAANRLDGGGGNDSLAGGAGNDTLIGGTGNDVLVGSSGRDLLVGGSGADRFVFLSALDSGVDPLLRDVVADFVSGVDKLDLSGIDANTLISGDQAFQVAKTWAGTLLPGTIWFTGGVLYGNVNGGSADFAIGLPGVTSLYTSDIVL